ncbi:MAG: hypothetical protein ACI4Q6_06295, partial [Huintestinicola sp.]
RRYQKCLCDIKISGSAKDDIYKLELLMNRAGITADCRKSVGAALEKQKSTGDKPAFAVELSDGRVITGKTGDLLGAASSALLNALKALAGIDQETDLVSAASIAPIQKLKTEYMGSRNPRLHSDEILIALSASAADNALAAEALRQLPALKGCDAHSTVIVSSVDEQVFKKLGVSLTCEPRYEEESRLYHKK